MTPARQNIHPFEERLRSALEDPGISILWNKRLSAWQVALFDPSRMYPPLHLWGAEGCENPRKLTHWIFITICAKAQIAKKPGQRPFVPIEPGEWLIPVLIRNSQRKNPECTTKERYSAASWAQFIDSHNNEVIAKEEACDKEAWDRETLKDGLHLLRGRKFITVNKLASKEESIGPVQADAG